MSDTKEFMAGLVKLGAERQGIREAASAGGGGAVAGQKDCYVGIKSCGCMVAWVHDSKDHPKDTAKAVARLIKEGYRVESANTDEIRSRLGPCKCKSPNNQAQPRRD